MIPQGVQLTSGNWQGCQENLLSVATEMGLSTIIRFPSGSCLSIELMLECLYEKLFVQIPHVFSLRRCCSDSHSLHFPSNSCGCPGAMQGS